MAEIKPVLLPVAAVLLLSGIGCRETRERPFSVLDQIDKIRDSVHASERARAATGYYQEVVKPVDQLTQPYHPDREAYRGQGGSVTIAQVRRLAEYDLTNKGQSTDAIESLLGKPDVRNDIQDVWDISGTGDQFMAANRLVVTYSSDGRTNGYYTVRPL